MKRTVAERLMALASVDSKGGCWIWNGSIDRHGYGKFNGPYATTAHRSSYIEFVGPIDDGKEIDHLCKVRNCINPAHMEPVVHAVNVARADYVSNHRNGRKTHCNQGHELSGENLVIESYGGLTIRKCRECRRIRSRIRYKARKGESK